MSSPQKKNVIHTSCLCTQASNHHHPHRVHLPSDAAFSSSALAASASSMLTLINLTEGRCCAIVFRLSRAAGQLVQRVVQKSVMEAPARAEGTGGVCMKRCVERLHHSWIHTERWNTRHNVEKKKEMDVFPSATSKLGSHPTSFPTR